MGETNLVKTDKDLSALVEPSRALAQSHIASRQSEATRVVTKSAMRQVAKAIGLEAEEWENILWAAMRPDDVRLIQARLAETRSPATVNTMMSTVKSMAQLAYEEGHLSHRELWAIQRVKRLRGSRVARGRRLTRGELKQLFGELVSAPGRKAVRDAALLGLALGLGLRRSELASFQVKDYNREQAELTILGKGNKQRRLPVNDGAQVYLERWLEIRGDGPGPVFYQFEKGDKMTEKGISPQVVNNVTRRWARESGIEAFSPHDCRRTFVSGLLGRDVDLSLVASLAGHANIQTTRIYDMRPFESMRKAAESWHIPTLERRPRKRRKKRRQG